MDGVRRASSADDFVDRFDELFAVGYRAGYAVLGRRAEAEDCAQEAMARALARWSRVEDHAAAWVARVATNLALDRVRRLERQRRHSPRPRRRRRPDRRAPPRPRAGAALVAGPPARGRRAALHRRPLRARDGAGDVVRHRHREERRRPRAWNACAPSSDRPGHWSSHELRRPPRPAAAPPRLGGARRRHRAGPADPPPARRSRHGRWPRRRWPPSSCRPRWPSPAATTRAAASCRRPRPRRPRCRSPRCRSRRCRRRPSHRPPLAADRPGDPAVVSGRRHPSATATPCSSTPTVARPLVLRRRRPERSAGRGRADRRRQRGAHPGRPDVRQHVLRAGAGQLRSRSAPTASRSRARSSTATPLRCRPTAPGSPRSAPSAITVTDLDGHILASADLSTARVAASRRA